MKELYFADKNRYDNGMEYERCGHSGILLPKVSLGFWHNFGSVDPYERSREITHYAFDHGITHFDLANNYGPVYGSAEETMGRLMDEDFRPYRDELFISSKAGYDMWPGPYGNWGSRKYLMASLDQSLKRMKIDYVDLFYSHRYDPETPLEETLQALVDIVRQGKALYVGISNWPLDPLKFGYEYLKAHDVPLLIYQGRLNMLDRKPQETGITDFCVEKGIGFIIVRFTKLNKNYLLFAKDLFNYLDTVNKSSISIDYFNEKGYLIKDKFIPSIDYLEIVDKYGGIYEEEKN